MFETATTPGQVRQVVRQSTDPVVIGFFGDFSATAREARPAFEQFCNDNADLRALYVDVGAVKGVHKDLGVTSVPTVVVVKDGTVLRKVVGSQSAAYYDRALVPRAHLARATGEEGRKAPSVTVYVGERCPWCTRVKAYLRQQRVRFHEIDVSRDPQAARDLQSRSGQTGVPQLNIDGQWVIGFDRPKIDSMLGLQANKA